MTQGSILALWSYSDPPTSKGFQEMVQLVREGEVISKNSRDWRGQVNILSWKHLGKIIGKDHRFEFRHCGKNICVTSADLSSVRKGDLIRVGTALLVTTRNGFTCPKRCHLEPDDST